MIPPEYIAKKSKKPRHHALDHSALASVLEQRDQLNRGIHEAQLQAYWGYSCAPDSEPQNVSPTQYAADLCLLAGEVAHKARSMDFCCANHDDLRASLIEVAALSLFWIDELKELKKIEQEEQANGEKVNESQDKGIVPD